MSERAALDQPSVNARRVVLGSAVLLYAMGTFGSNIAPAWIKIRPEIVLALSARNRNLLASVPFVNPLAYALIGFVRVMVVGLVLYLVGRWFGTKALGWMEGQLGELPAIYRWARTWMDKAGWLLVLLMPGSNLVCLMAGHRKMNVRLFTAMMTLGAIGKLVVLWIGGRIFDHQIRSFLDFIDGYQWWIVGGLFLLTFLQAGNRARKQQAPKILDELGHPPALDSLADAVPPSLDPLADPVEVSDGTDPVR